MRIIRGIQTLVIIISIVFGSISVSADDGQNLGTFDLKISSAPWDPRLNRMDIGSPKADVVYATFNYTSMETATYRFNPGSGGSYNCDTSTLDHVFVITKADVDGAVDQKVPLGGTYRFQQDFKYTVRYNISKFTSTKCEWINTSFITFKTE